MRTKQIKAYITGICGFAGSWLAEELIAHGYTVKGAALPKESDRNIRHIRSKIKIDRFDITNPKTSEKYIKLAKPDYLFHLAAFASVIKSWGRIDEVFRVNINGTQNILNAARNMKSIKKIIIVSSSDVYGIVKPKDMPLKPGRLLNPVSPYSQTKVAVEYLAQSYIEYYDLPAIIVRSFNHSGPRQSTDFVIPSLCQKISKAENQNGKSPVTIGNMEARRDFSDVRDIVRGYRMIAERGKIGRIYQLCSGRDKKVSEILGILISFAKAPIKVKRDKKLMRKSDIPILRGSYYNTKKDVGWKPSIPIEKTLYDTLEYWRKKYSD